MQQYPFIFSDKRRYRLQRHLLFWGVWWIFQSFLYSFVAGVLNTSYFQRLPLSTFDSLVYLSQHVFLSYTLMYWVLPRFLLKGRYTATVAAVVVLCFITALMAAVTGFYLLGPLHKTFFGTNDIEHPNQISIFLGLLAGLRGGLTVGGIALAIKVTKHWYVKEQRNMQLQKENISAQLQLLKAQVQPHFLFNTLNNIYSSAQVTAPAAAKMIMGLSSLLRYMLHDCNEPLVPLNKELKMLEEYMLLEQSRYGNQLELHIDLPQTNDRTAIAPLLLLPFVENSFKHGASRMLEQPWINLHISIEDGWLKMKLLNGKSAEKQSPQSGIGLMNVQQRLQLLYPQKHTLHITDEAEVFIVNLKLLLDSAPATPLSQRLKEAVYE